MTPIKTMTSTIIATGLNELSIIYSSKNSFVTLSLILPPEGGMGGKLRFHSAGRAEMKWPGGFFRHKDFSF